MTADALIYLNARQAESGRAGRVVLPRDYVLACRFFRCGIMDRTRSLDQGFDYVTLDPIPPPDGGASFAELCDRTGAELVEEALDAGRRLRLLWSGGIDSTTALIAVMKAAEERGCREIVRVLVSFSSVQENPVFFRQHLYGRYSIEPVSHPVSEFLDAAALNVTGEHGDQLFGSQFLEPYVRRGLASEPYREILPFVLLERLRNPVSARRVGHYLEPVIAAAPVPIRTLFDYMWWLNFSLKWQDVTLRLTALRGERAHEVYGSLRHFFRSPAFQAWSLANPAIREVATWARYKEPAKRYILEFTGDEDYYRTKEKEDSLRNVLLDPQGEQAVRAFMRADFRPVVTAFVPAVTWSSRVREKLADRLG